MSLEKIKLSPEVVREREAVMSCHDDDLYAVASKLIPAETEGFDGLFAMWKTLEKYHVKNSEPSWVVSFLYFTYFAMKQDRFHDLNKDGRKDLVERINDNATALCRDLQEYGLDNGKLYLAAGLPYDNDRLMFYNPIEDLIAHSFPKGDHTEVRGSDVIKAVAANAIDRIKNESSRQKKSVGFKARQFAIELARLNLHAYGKALLDVVATATNALYPGMNYNKSSVHRAVKNLKSSQ